MTDPHAPDWAMDRIAELERWQQVDLENYKQHLAELTEMVTAATVTAVQRGKVLDAIRARCINDYDEPFLAEDVEHILDGADGG